MHKTQAIADDLDDFEGEPAAEPTPERREVEWSGRRTRIRLAHPILRGTADSPAGRFIDNTTPCIDCGQLGHAFHADASRVDGRWIGPEGDHIQALQAGGWLAGTGEAKARAQRQRLRDEQVGPEASLVLSAADLARLWKFEVIDGHVNTAIESGLRRDEAEALRSAVKSGLGDLAESIHAALAERAATK